MPKTNMGVPNHSQEGKVAKIFVRERRNVGQGTGTPRFEIVAVSDIDLRVYHSHVRRAEVERIASDLGAEIVDLPAGEGDGPEEGPRHGRHGRGGGGGRHGGGGQGGRGRGAGEQAEQD
jgi:hypothetical protein